MPIDMRDDRRSTPPESNQAGNGWFILFLLLLLFNFLFFRTHRSSITDYSEFIHQVEAGKVDRAEIGADRIRYTLKSLPSANQTTPENQAKSAVEQTLETIPIPTDTELPQILRQHQVKFAALPAGEASWIWGLLSFLMMPLLFLVLWIWLLSRGQGIGTAALTVGKSKARIYSEGDTGATFSDVAGVDEAKAELQEIVDFLKHTDKYIRLGAKIPKGVLLIGPPGTGKTLLARAIAGEAGVPFFSISGSEFIELFVGVGAARVRDLFEQAKQQAPCIVFIDELDALGRSRMAAGVPMGNEEREQTLNQLLSEMDGFDPNTGVILLAATNRPEVLDPALLRPGRFDRQIMVDRPDRNGREAILDVHAQAVKLADDVDLAKLAARTPGFAGADLANLVNEAALLAARKNQDAVMMADFNEAIERLLTGLEKKSRVLNDLEKKTVAYHEAGHALVGTLMPGAGKIEKISVVPRGFGSLGYTLQLPEEDRFLMIENELRGRIAILLGGRSAEELIFDQASTGASDDIQKATDLAERLVTLYGMSEALGPIAFEKIQQQFLDTMVSPRRAVSPKVAEAIDQEVKTIIDGAHHMALAILRLNRDLLEETAQALLERETLEGNSLKERLHQVQAPPALEKWLRTGKLFHSHS